MEETKKITGEVWVRDKINKLIKTGVKHILQFKEALEKTFDKTATEIIEVLMAGAFYLDSSDIHIEAKEKSARIRVRIDGVLHDVLDCDLRVYKLLLSRLKLLAGLKLNITTRPQDGRFSLFLEGSSIEIRASSLPSEYGESIVLRILNPKWVVSMEELGLREDLLKTFEYEIRRPNGMIVCTGPTGCGKTTTLYAFLQKINNPEIKIITIEDPIEYHLKGVSQTQVNPKKGYDFASGLRSIVRQDPDVILVGEIRDFETAKIALQAALTGHLVLSTVHTNDAAGTIARLQALGEKLPNIAPAINLIIGQRLVRKVCPKCVQFEKIEPEILKKITQALKGLPEKVKIPELSPEIELPKVKGCPDCNFTGYRGRIGIFEAFLVDAEMEKFILTNPSIAELREKAIQKGMVPMQKDGILKVLNKITTLEEVERTTGPI
jgi:type IV pilus assembly protein PilB